MPCTSVCVIEALQLPVGLLETTTVPEASSSLSPMSRLLPIVNLGLTNVLAEIWMLPAPVANMNTSMSPAMPMIPVAEIAVPETVRGVAAEGALPTSSALYGRFDAIFARSSS